MRALTIYEPYAGLIVGGVKTIEVRRRRLKYRGPLLIHAAQERDRPAAVVGIAELVDCRPLSEADLAAAVLRELPAHQAYGLVLRDVRRLPGRVEWRGRQGLWLPEPLLQELVAEVLGRWGQEVAEAARRAGLRLSRRKHMWRVHPPGQSDADIRYVTDLPRRLSSEGKLTSVEVCGSREDGERAYREGASLWDLGDVHEIKKRREARMGRVTKKEVAEAAPGVGLRLLGTKTKQGEWALVDEKGKPVFADRSLASLRQYCRDREAAQAAPESMPAAPAVVEDAPPNGAPVPHLTAAEAAAGAAEADRLYGGELPYDRERVTAEIAHYLSQGALSILAAGQRLIQLKEHEPHGEWLGLLKRIGIGHDTAKRMMRASRKFLDGPNGALVPHLNSATKLYELALMDDDDLAELREGGTIAGATLDDIQRMSPSELRAALRAERQERKEREDAQRERIRKKDAKIGQLESGADDLIRTLNAERHPGRQDWKGVERDLLLESARTDMELRRAVENYETLVERLHEHAGKEYERTQSSLRDLRNVPGAEALLSVRGRLDATASYLHAKLSEIDERLSDHLATERPAPDDVAPSWTAALRDTTDPDRA